MATQTFNENLPIGDVADFTSADTTTSKVVTTSRATPSRIDAIICTSTVATDHIVNVFYRPNGGSDELLGSVNVPASTGLSGTKGIDVLAGALPTNLAGFALPIGAQLSLGMAVTIASGTIHATAVGGTL